MHFGDLGVIMIGCGGVSKGGGVVVSGWHGASFVGVGLQLVGGFL